MRKVFYLSIVSLVLMTITIDLKAQNILNRVERGVRSAQNASKNIQKSKEKQQQKEERSNPKSVEKSSFHEKNIGKILFAKGSTNANLEESGLFVTTLDLNSPSFFNVYLEDPLYAIHARNHQLKEYSVVPKVFGRKYYINGELIAEYTDEIDEIQFKQNAIFSDVLVPANYDDFKQNEMRVGVLAYVFSSLNPGTHKFKVEYVMTKSTPKTNNTGSAAIEYDNQDYVVASGEVDIKVDANSVNSYAKQYGRPKFSKGVIEGDKKLEEKLRAMVKSDANRTPIYMYASDSWTIKRGDFDRIIGREARVYYVFKNSTGRCELADFFVYQSYEGNGYGNPVFSRRKDGLPFKFVVCQNY